MKLEMNLTRIRSVLNPIGTLITRKRVLVDTDSEILNQLLQFLKENEATITTRVDNPSLISWLNKPAEATVDDLKVVRYMLKDAGLDLRYYWLDDNMSSPEDLAADDVEYTLVDSNNVLGGHVKQAHRTILQTMDGKAGVSVYQHFFELKGMFDPKYFGNKPSGVESSISSQMDIAENLGQSLPDQLAYVAVAFEALGYRLEILTPMT
jgi:hypothetical protein